MNEKGCEKKSMLQKVLQRTRRVAQYIIYGSNPLLRKGIWNVAEDGLGAVHSEHNLMFMPQMRRKYSDSIATIKVGGTGYAR